MMNDDDDQIIKIKMLMNDDEVMKWWSDDKLVIKWWSNDDQITIKWSQTFPQVLQQMMQCTKRWNDLEMLTSKYFYPPVTLLLPPTFILCQTSFFFHYTFFTRCKKTKQGFKQTSSYINGTRTHKYTNTSIITHTHTDTQTRNAHINITV